MTDADTQMAAGAASPVATLVAGSGLIPEPNVIDGAGLATVPGPLLTADLVDAGGTVVASIAVLDDPSAEPDAMVQAMAQAAAAEAGLGTEVRASDPVADGSELSARFTTPVTVAAFGDGDRIRSLIVTAAERRGGSGAATGSPASGPEAVIPGVVASAVPGGSGPLDKLINVSLDVSVELGRTRVTLAEVLDYDVGSVVELDRPAGAPVDIRVNGTLLAQGEVVLIDDEYAVRITAILDPNAS